VDAGQKVLRVGPNGKQFLKELSNRFLPKDGREFLWGMQKCRSQERLEGEEPWLEVEQKGPKAALVVVRGANGKLREGIKLNLKNFPIEGSKRDCKEKKGPSLKALGRIRVQEWGGRR